MKYIIVRAAVNSPMGKEFRHLAFALDAHKCLIFLCKDTGERGNLTPVPIKLMDDPPFEELYERWLRA